MRRALPATLALALGLAAGAAPARAADPFYVDLLRQGGLSYQRGEAPRAARQLRLACFGLLDEPRMLGECLARLALAEDKRGDATGFREAFRRLCDVEERFGGYGLAAAAMPAELKAQLEKRLAAAMPAPILEQSPPVFRALLPRPGSAAAGTGRRPQPAPRAAPPESGGAGPATEPPAVTAPATTPVRASPPPAAPAPAAPNPAPARALTAEEKGRLEEVRRTLDQPADGRVLAQAYDAARAVAEAHAGAPEAQRLAAESAYRIKRFREAAEYFRRAGDPGDGAPELLFYQAVSLFETGDKERAAAALKRALPNLRRTPYVDGYAQKILGSAALGIQ